MVDVPRRRVSKGPALAYLTRRRCRTALFALRETATSDPFFRCAHVLLSEDSELLFMLSYTTAAANAVGVALATPPEAINTGPGFNRGSGGGARGCGFEGRVGAYARTKGCHFL